MTFDPDWVVCPGELIVEELDERGWTHRYLADRLGLSLTEFARLLDGDLLLTETLARRLAIMTGTSFSLWLNLESIYRNGLARGKVHIEHEVRYA